MRTVFLFKWSRAVADEGNSMIYRFGDCVLDTDSETLRRSDEVVSVEPRAFKVLCYLFEHRNRVVTRDELFEACWPESFVSDATLTSCLRRVRQAIGQTRNGLICQHFSGQTIKLLFGSPHRPLGPGCH